MISDKINAFLLEFTDLLCNLLKLSGLFPLGE